MVTKKQVAAGIAVAAVAGVAGWFLRCYLSPCKTPCLVCDSYYGTPMVDGKCLPPFAPDPTHPGCCVYQVPTQNPCPSVDFPESAGGQCPPGYIPDTTQGVPTGCCAPAPPASCTPPNIPADPFGGCPNGYTGVGNNACCQPNPTCPPCDSCCEGVDCATQCPCVQTCAGCEEGGGCNCATDCPCPTCNCGPNCPGAEIPQAPSGGCPPPFSLDATTGCCAPCPNGETLLSPCPDQYTQDPVFTGCCIPPGGGGPPASPNGGGGGGSTNPPPPSQNLILTLEPIETAVVPSTPVVFNVTGGTPGGVYQAFGIPSGEEFLPENETVLGGFLFDSNGNGLFTLPYSVVGPLQFVGVTDLTTGDAVLLNAGSQVPIASPAVGSWAGVSQGYETDPAAGY